MAPVLAAAMGVIRAALAASPRRLLPAVAKRLGLSGDLSAQGVLNLIKDNPTSTAMVLLEMGETGAAALADLRAASSEIDALVETLTLKQDVIDEDFTIFDIARFADEFDAIDEAAALLGGVDRLLALRNALKIDPKVIALRMQVQEMG